MGTSFWIGGLIVTDLRVQLGSLLWILLSVLTFYSLSIVFDTSLKIFTSNYLFGYTRYLQWY